MSLNAQQKVKLIKYAFEHPEKKSEIIEALRKDASVKTASDGGLFWSTLDLITKKKNAHHAAQSLMFAEDRPNWPALGRMVKMRKWDNQIQDLVQGLESVLYKTVPVPTEERKSSHVEGAENYWEGCKSVFLERGLGEEDLWHFLTDTLILGKAQYQKFLSKPEELFKIVEKEKPIRPGGYSLTDIREAIFDLDKIWAKKTVGEAFGGIQGFKRVFGVDVLPQEWFGVGNLSIPMAILYAGLKKK